MACRARNDAAAPKVRHNPLIGNYTPAEPATPSPQRDNAASTDKPAATTLPHPDKAPVSSAEVAPNADLPPRPPPSNSPGATIPSETPSSSASASGPPQKHPYSATQPASNPLFNDSFAQLLSRVNTSAPSTVARNDPLEQPRVRTKAVSGRTVHVAPHISQTTAMNAPQAVSIMESMIRAQGVRRKFNYQRFHERGGLKRKRLRSERWQRRFKMGFQATCQRVLELKRQGW